MANQQTQKRKPTHDVLHVKGEGDSARWTKIGAAWMHENQGGLNVQLEFMPVGNDGRLVIKLRTDKSKTNGEAQA